MNPYYQSVLKDIVELYSKGEFEKVDSIVKSELAMPYVERDALQLLEHYEQECRGHLYQHASAGRADIEEMVHGDLKQKERAASVLQGMNLRTYQSEVQSLLLDAELIDEFKGELIEAMMEQNLSDEFKVLKNGKIISFHPNQILPSASDPVLNEANKLLENWLGADNPVMARFCKEMLEQETLERRPYDFSGLDSKALAASIARLVFEAMSDEDGWEHLKYENNLESVNEIPLKIKERGE